MYMLRLVGIEQALSLSCNSTEREPDLRLLCITPLGFCLKDIVKQLLNLEKKTSSVISVILISLQ